MSSMKIHQKKTEFLHFSKMPSYNPKTLILVHICHHVQYDSELLILTVWNKQCEGESFSRCLLWMCEPGHSSRVLPLIYTFSLFLSPCRSLFFTHTHKQSLCHPSVCFPHLILVCFSFSQLPLCFSPVSSIHTLPFSISFTALACLPSSLVLFLLLSLVAAFFLALLHCVL